MNSDATDSLGRLLDLPTELQLQVLHDILDSDYLEVSRTTQAAFLALLQSSK